MFGTCCGQGRGGQAFSFSAEDRRRTNTEWLRNLDGVKDQGSTLLQYFGVQPVSPAPLCIGQGNLPLPVGDLTPRPPATSPRLDATPAQGVIEGCEWLGLRLGRPVVCDASRLMHEGWCDCAGLPIAEWPKLGEGWESFNLHSDLQPR